MSILDNVIDNVNVVKDKIGDFIVLISIAIVSWIWHKAVGIDKRFSDLQLDLIKNYVTKPELGALEDKLDTHNVLLSNKIDAVNTSILTLTTFLLKDK